MNKNEKNEHLEILRNIKNTRIVNQRDLAFKTGFSLGKLNYCIKELRNKGFIKIQNFKKNPNKFNPMSKANYLYILTPKGFIYKSKLTVKFMKLKMKEYDELKKDLENDKK
tara:strand:- start:2107 stop:2439 length:333 start_codon:yes stop_codon:yes gene_type:complete